MSFEDRGRAGITASSHCFGVLHQLFADHLAITYVVAPQSSAKPLTNQLFCGKLIKFALQICFANLALVRTHGLRGRLACFVAYWSVIFVISAEEAAPRWFSAFGCR